MHIFFFLVLPFSIIFHNLLSISFSPFSVCTYVWLQLYEDSNFRSKKKNMFSKSILTLQNPAKDFRYTAEKIRSDMITPAIF